MGWGGEEWVGWFFSDYRVSPNFLLCWGWVVVEVGLGCDKNIHNTSINYFHMNLNLFAI